MSIDNMILDFIKSRRINAFDNDFLESEQDKIKEIYDRCLLAITKEYNAEYMPNLIICRTYNKYSTVLPVRIKNNDFKYYILFDCYLRDINRLLNALYFDDNDSGHDIWKLSYELFAEDALIDNRDVLLSYYGLNKVALGPFDVDIKSQEDLEFYVEIQDVYIMGHELGHWIYKASSDLNKNKIFNIDINKKRSVLLKEIKDILCEVYDDYQKNFHNRDYVQLINEQRNIVDDEKSSIHEECFADAISYAIVFNYIQTEYDDAADYRLKAAQALLLGMMNLQLLAMQQMCVVEESFESSVSIRLGFFRNYVDLYLERESKRFLDIIQNTVLRYENRITDLILECFAELERRADNIYDGLINVNGQLDMSKILGFSNEYKNSYIVTDK